MAGVYRLRHPKRTVLYRVLFHYFARLLAEFFSREVFALLLGQELISGSGGEDLWLAPLWLLSPQQGPGQDQERGGEGGKIHDPSAPFAGKRGHNTNSTISRTLRRKKGNWYCVSNY